MKDIRIGLSMSAMYQLGIITMEKEEEISKCNHMGNLNQSHHLFLSAANEINTKEGRSSYGNVNCKKPTTR